MREQNRNLSLPSESELSLLVLHTLISLKDSPTFKEIRAGVLILLTDQNSFEENQSIIDHFRSFKMISHMNTTVRNMLLQFEKFGFVQRLPFDKWRLTSGFIDVFSTEVLNNIYDVNKPLGARSIKELLQT